MHVELSRAIEKDPVAAESEHILAAPHPSTRSSVQIPLRNRLQAVHP